MASSTKDGLIFEQLKPGQLTLRGSAAWKQTQLTPGVSTQAAPLQCGFASSKKNSRQMTMSYAALLLGVIAGWGGLLAGLVLLNENALFAVLGILGAMALLLASLARLCQNDRDRTVSITRPTNIGEK